jgi:hypothetical protein
VCGVLSENEAGEKFGEGVDKAAGLPASEARSFEFDGKLERVKCDEHGISAVQLQNAEEKAGLRERNA